MQKTQFLQSQAILVNYHKDYKHFKSLFKVSNIEYNHQYLIFDLKRFSKLTSHYANSILSILKTKNTAIINDEGLPQYASVEIFLREYALKVIYDIFLFISTSSFDVVRCSCPSDE